MIQKKAFTLSEVLITVAVLGIIAAITIPSIIRFYEKRQTITKLQKIYADINKALSISVIENGHMNNWRGTKQEQIRNYIVPYFKLKSVVTMPEVRQAAGNKFYRISRTQETGLGVMRDLFDNEVLAMNLTNGIQIWVLNHYNYRIDIYVDLNGAKKPNIFGKDIFWFVYWDKDNIFDFNMACDTDSKYIKKSIADLKAANSCSDYACNKNKRGMWCGAIIEASGWKIPNDYPW